MAIDSSAIFNRWIFDFKSAFIPTFLAQTPTYIESEMAKRQMSKLDKSIDTLFKEIFNVGQIEKVLEECTLIIEKNKNLNNRAYFNDKLSGLNSG